MRFYIANIFLNLIAVVVFTTAFLTTFNNIRFYDQSDIRIGKVSKVNLQTVFSNGRNLNAYEFEINNDKKKLFLTAYETLDYNIQTGDSIVFKNLYINETNAKVLSVNGKKVDSYYGVFDLLMLISLIVIILSYYYYFKFKKRKKYKNKKKEYNLMYNQKRKRS
ncbi:hypothetical protein [Flavobacterium hungaricum]|uniref:Uncharacterized protein n=1 Tax=Flavobacterium hungaricum TaxID=2082725 RepID=A0ABR9TQI5_9FLAO|nr:hypothetical protein [Flavobacterium hungaricum]MBE8727631.1 hypothetical protein [Flavobacterium hungaricum]